MKTISEIRLDNLELLVREHGSQDKVAELAGTSPVYLSQLFNKAMDSKTGRPRQIGDPLARKLEIGCKKEIGWMDNAHPPHSYRNERIHSAVLAMEAMDDNQLERAYKILHTLAEPPSHIPNGTTGL